MGKPPTIPYGLDRIATQAAPRPPTAPPRPQAEVHAAVAYTATVDAILVKFQAYHRRPPTCIEATPAIRQALAAQGGDDPFVYHGVLVWPFGGARANAAQRLGLETVIVTDGPTGRQEEHTITRPKNGKIPQFLPPPPYKGR